MHCSSACVAWGLAMQPTKVGHLIASPGINPAIVKAFVHRSPADRLASLCCRSELVRSSCSHPTVAQLRC
eukprot:4353359-Amphidinium_carterae.1